MFITGRKLVRITRVKAKSADIRMADGTVMKGQELLVPGVDTVSPTALLRDLSLATRWARMTTKGELVFIAPPKEVAFQILCMVNEWPFSPLNGIISTQTIRSDGTLLLCSGYDSDTGYLLHNPPPIPSIPDRPTKDDARDALALFRDLLGEFPFASEASFSVAMSGILTALARPGVGATAPLHLATSPTAGSGKSTLWDVAAIIATGERCPVISMSPQPEEFEKRLVGMALSCVSLFSIDNISTLIAGDTICQMVERPIMSLRALGKSDMHAISNSLTVFGTGNSARVHRDMVRRTLVSELDANMERPETRVFARPNLLNQLVRDRGRYIAAGLTILRAYIEARLPGRLPQMPSYADWSDLVRSPLVWLGCADPVRSIQASSEEDPDAVETAALIAAWPRGPRDLSDYKAAELVEAATERDGFGSLARPELYEAIATIATDKTSLLSADKLGNWLRDHRGQVSEGLKLVRRGTRTRPSWTVEAVADVGAGGAVGVSYPGAREKSNDSGGTEETTPTTPSTPTRGWIDI
jgi:putative DNA primase/helicase